MKRPRRPLHVWILLALVAGALLGVLLNVAWTGTTWKTLGVENASAFLAGTTDEANAQAGLAASVVRFVVSAARFTGDLFLRLLRLIAVPVVLFSLVAAVAGVGSGKELGRMGAKTIGVFALTATLAVILALVIANAVRPGRFVDAATRDALIAQRSADAASRATMAGEFAAKNTLWSQVLDSVASNPFAALASGNMLQVVTLSLLLGVGLTLVPAARRRPVTESLETLAEACLKLVGLIMKLAPVAVFCLSAGLVATLGWSVLQALSVFVAATVGGLAIILFFEYPAVMWLLTPASRRMRPKEFFRGTAPAQALAFSSSSSAATMPVTMECCDRLGVPRSVSSLVVPLGTTINMDGTALYQVMSVTFLAQLFGIPLDFGQQATVALMSIFVAIGSPGLPGASIVLMVFVLEAVGVPVSGLAIILAVDRLLDMCRTVVNVSGDACAAIVVAGKDRVRVTQPGA